MASRTATSLIDGEPEQEPLDVQLERGRAAARSLRTVLLHFPTAKPSIRQVQPVIFYSICSRAHQNTCIQPTEFPCSTAWSECRRFCTTRAHALHISNSGAILPMQMLWRLDNSEALDMAGVRNPHLQGLLEIFFNNLDLLQVKKVHLELRRRCFMY